LTKLRVGIAGVGKLGRYHGQNLLQLPNVELVGVHDINPERGQRIAEEFGVRYYPQYSPLLQDVDAVTIAVPTVNHYELAREALERKKATFIEKPIAATVEEARTLVQLAESSGTVLQVGHIERFNPAFACLDRSQLQPMFVEAHRLASFDPRGTDVAVVLDLMIHDLDLVLSLVDSPIRRIDASGVAVVSDSEDIANARIQFENGCVANLTASRISLKKMRKMRLFQRDAYISIDLLLGLAEIYRLREIPKDLEVEPAFSWAIVEKGGKRKQIVYEKRQAENTNALKLELESFVNAALSGSPPAVSGRDGLRALEVAMQILKRIHEHRYEVG
jgi:predicted dehydrogenase